MVSNTRPWKLALALIPLVLCAVLLLGGLSRILGEDKPTITEEYKVTVDNVGDGHIVDTITYSKTDFNAVKKDASKNKYFLTRRFTTEDNRGEVVHFKTDINSSRHAVVITYVKPGYAYYEDSGFVIYGVDTKPKKKADGTFTYEERSTVNSEFTLFTDQVFLTKSAIQLPQSAKNARYESSDKSIRYEMPPASAQLGFLSDNKITMSVVLGICTLLFLGLLGFVLTRKPVEQTAVAFAPPVQVAPSSVPPAATPPAPAREKTGFCRNCGHPLAPGKAFCINCGEHV